MKPKIKSLLYLTCFSLCALFYYQLEENDKVVKKLNNSNFAAIEIIEAEIPEINTTIQEVIMNDEIK